tara:strand:+ start:3137 stop:3433 length:297 start_codon:yes stop_codon:yes gene_type:complete
LQALFLFWPQGILGTAQSFDSSCIKKNVHAYVIGYPSLMNSFFRLPKKDIYVQLILSSFAPILAFILTTYNDRLPTTVLILFIVFFINLGFGIIKNRL